MTDFLLENAETELLNSGRQPAAGSLSRLPTGLIVSWFHPYPYIREVLNPRRALRLIHRVSGGFAPAGYTKPIDSPRERKVSALLTRHSHD